MARWHSGTRDVAHLVREGETRSVCGLASVDWRELDQSDHLCGVCKKISKDETPCQCPLHRASRKGTE